MYQNQGQPPGQGGEEFIRVRTPRGREVIGVVAATLGSSRFKITCQDNVSRVCRIPGKSKRMVWVRDGDIVLIEPWEVEPKEKGDIVFRYTRTQAEVLRRRGFLKGLF